MSIGTHRLHLSSYGPDRSPDTAAVIIIPGLASSIKSWAAVRRLLAPYIRIYLYDRSGYGGSDISPEPPTSTNIASELDALLKSARIDPPYIFVAHSWGGILSREFLSLRPDEIAGIVFVEANQERTLEVLDWRNPVLWEVAKGIDYMKVTGLEKENKLMRDEWRAYREEENTEKHQKQAEAEMREYAASFPTLAAKEQLCRDDPILGHKPVSVICGQSHRDFERLYEAGVKRGNGTEEQRAEYRELLRTWQKKNAELQLELKTLSHNSSWSDAECGHHVQLFKPQIIVDEVLWVKSKVEP